MDRAWIDQLTEALGPRYRARFGTESAELEYRSRKTGFHPSRFTVGGASGRELSLLVDVRVPRGSTPEDSDPLLAQLEACSLNPRGLTRRSDELAVMKNQRGEEAGWARTLSYGGDVADAAEAARHVRSIVESIDIPIVVGVHDTADLIAREPMKPPPKPGRRHDELLAPLRFRLHSSVLRDLSVFIDLNTRTLTVGERSGLSTKAIGEPLKLAHVAQLATREADGQISLIATTRDDQAVTLATDKASAGFIETCARMAKRLRIPFDA